jgi:hypothetical protein
VHWRDADARRKARLTRVARASYIINAMIPESDRSAITRDPPSRHVPHYRTGLNDTVCRNSECL